MTGVSEARVFVTVFNSVFLLIYALFAILMIVKKTHSNSLTGKLGIQLLCSSILYSIALLIPGEHDDNKINKSNDSTNQNKDLSVAQIIQIILTVQSLLTTMSFVSAISYILYTNFRSPEKISNNSRKYLIVLSLICWLLPLPLALISHLDILEFENTKGTFNFIQSKPLYFIFYSLFLITYIITFVCITLLKVEVSKFIKEYGDDPKYIKYIRRLNRLVAIVIISTIIFGIDIVNEVYEGGIMDIICDVLEPMIVPFFFFFFAMNADQWNEFKKFYNCKKEPSNVNLIEKDNETELL